MATYYVRTDGHDTATGANPTNDGTTGAFLTIGKLASTVAAGDTGVICADNAATYTLTSSVTWSTSGSTGAGFITISGGDATGTTDGTRPTITSSTNSVDLFFLQTVSYLKFQFLKFTHTAGTRGAALSASGATSTGQNIKVVNCFMDGCSYGFDAGSRSTNTWMVGTTIQNSTTQAINFLDYLGLDGCLLWNNTGYGINDGSGDPDNVAISNTVFAGHSSAIVLGGASRNHILNVRNVTIRDCSSDGIFVASVGTSGGALALVLENTIFWNNGGYGINLSDTTLLSDFYCYINSHNAYGSNTPADRNHLSAGWGDVALTVDPNVASGNYALNSTGGGGAVCRAAAFPGAFAGGTTTGYLDIGAVQSQGTSGGLNLPITWQLGP